MLLTREADVDESIVKLIEGLDVSLATNHSISVLIRISVRIQEIFDGILTTARHMGSCKNLAGSAALAEVFGLRVLLVMSISVYYCTSSVINQKRARAH